MWPHLLLWGATLPLWALGNIKISRYCDYLEYWDLHRGCCRRCLERFGPPNCPNFEFSRHCGLSDHGDQLDFPYSLCSPGLCNRDWAERCSPCPHHPLSPSWTPAQPLAVRAKRYRSLCPQEPIPPRNWCPRENVTRPMESLSPASSRGPESTTGKGSQEPQGSPKWIAVWYVVGITALLAGGLLVSATLSMFLGKSESKEKAAEAGETCKFFPLTEGSVPPTLAHQPLSRLLDELEVLEELVVLLDPEPGPCGGSAWGTTRHLAARYGLPASWATFAYSLRPARSPLRALLETVTARDPTAQLGQLADHLGQLGRGDALGVLTKLK
ncbi:IGF-like family receptor 1 [Dromiciops gliroides]|uniref:IGF-like family receptor 1 n=1 Tax=Dromiciops gliroides TaxID=33562 RepID=UPI001CC4BB08|nr:IGF-like family receptor 1 [Dromiciops gliroides]